MGYPISTGFALIGCLDVSYDPKSKQFCVYELQSQNGSVFGPNGKFSTKQNQLAKEEMLRDLFGHSNFIYHFDHEENTFIFGDKTQMSNTQCYIAEPSIFDDDIAVNARKNYVINPHFILNHKNLSRFLLHNLNASCCPPFVYLHSSELACEVMPSHFEKFYAKAKNKNFVLKTQGTRGEGNFFTYGNTSAKMLWQKLYTEAKDWKVIRPSKEHLVYFADYVNITTVDEFFTLEACVNHTYEKHASRVERMVFIALYTPRGQLEYCNVVHTDTYFNEPKNYDSHQGKAWASYYNLAYLDLEKQHIKAPIPPLAKKDLAHIRRNLLHPFFEKYTKIYKDISAHIEHVWRRYSDLCSARFQNLFIESLQRTCKKHQPKIMRGDVYFEPYEIKHLVPKAKHNPYNTWQNMNRFFCKSLAHYGFGPSSSKSKQKEFFYYSTNLNSYTYRRNRTFPNGCSQNECKSLKQDLLPFFQHGMLLLSSLVGASELCKRLNMPQYVKLKKIILRQTQLHCKDFFQEVHICFPLIAIQLDYFLKINYANLKTHLELQKIISVSRKFAYLSATFEEL